MGRQPREVVRSRRQAAAAWMHLTTTVHDDVHTRPHPELVGQVAADGRATLSLHGSVQSLRRDQLGHQSRIRVECQKVEARDASFSERPSYRLVVQTLAALVLALRMQASAGLGAAVVEGARTGYSRGRRVRPPLPPRGVCRARHDVPGIRRRNRRTVHAACGVARSYCFEELRREEKRSEVKG